MSEITKYKLCIKDLKYYKVKKISYALFDSEYKVDSKNGK